MDFSKERAEVIAARYRQALKGLRFHGHDKAHITEVEVVEKGNGEAVIEVRAPFNDGNTFKAELDEYLDIIGMHKNYN